jgi:hypothetical protein
MAFVRELMMDPITTATSGGTPLMDGCIGPAAAGLVVRARAVSRFHWSTIVSSAGSGDSHPAGPGSKHITEG